VIYSLRLSAYYITNFIYLICKQLNIVLFNFVLLFFSFARPKEKNEKKKTASGFQRPTFGSIPKPGKPFGTVFIDKLYFYLLLSVPHFSAWL